MPIPGVGVTYPIGKTNNSHDIFITIDGAIEIVVHSRCDAGVMIQMLFIDEHIQA